MKLASIIILLLGVVSLYATHFISPINEIDTGWDFSHAYSISRGHYFWIDYIARPIQYFYGIIIYPFTFLASAIYLPSVFYVIIASVFAIVILKKGNYTKAALLLSLAILFDHTIHVQRPEIFILLLIILGEPFIFLNSEPRFKILIPFCVILLLLHPSASFIGISGLFIYHQPTFLSKINILFLVLILLSLLFTFITISPKSHYTNHFLARVFSGHQIPNFLKYLKFSGITFLGFAFLSHRIIKVKFLLLFTLLWCATALISGAYYFSLLLVPFILHLVKSSKEEWTSKDLKILTLMVSFNFIVTALHPIIVHIENPSYSKQVNSIYTQLSNQPSEIKIYSEHSFGAVLYENNPNARTLIYLNNKLTCISDTLKANDKLYSYTLPKLKSLHTQLTTMGLQFESKCILEPVNGLLQLSSLYTKRTDNLFLWETTIRSR